MDTAPGAEALDLEFNEDQRAICDALARFCGQADAEAHARASGEPFPRALWRELAGLGVFAAGAPAYPDAGGVLEICAGSEALGQNLFPGPVAATFLAAQVAADPAPIIEGEQLVSLSRAGSNLLPFGTEADLFLVAGADVRAAAPPDNVEAVATLGGETWGRAALTPGEALPGSERGLLVHNISSAAYIAGAALRLLRDTSEHAATRKQFGHTLGEFQAVTHPLADCVIAVTAAQVQARAAACAADGGGENAATLAAGAVMSACRAGLATAFACHQIYGAIGVTLEGPAFHISRRIRQLATEACGARERDILLAGTGLGG